MRAREFMESKVRSGYQALELSQASRIQLAQMFPAKFGDFIGHHITYAFGVKSDVPLPEVQNIEVVGYAVDPQGIEALVVSVNGTTVRPDGKTFHITWSLDRDAGFKPVHSNDLVSKGWTKVQKVINITATAKFI
jgi:hypothetical protein